MRNLEDDLSLVEDLINVAQTLAKEQGHILGCKFSSCTCGQVERCKEALSEFWRLYRKYETNGGFHGCIIKKREQRDGG